MKESHSGLVTKLMFPLTHRSPRYPGRQRLLLFLQPLVDRFPGKPPPVPLPASRIRIRRPGSCRPGRAESDSVRSAASAELKWRYGDSEAMLVVLQARLEERNQAVDGGPGAGRRSGTDGCRRDISDPGIPQA